jgi:hypothetical protein
LKLALNTNKQTNNQIPLTHQLDLKKMIIEELKLGIKTKIGTYRMLEENGVIT